jgi:hypothetical protein
MILIGWILATWIVASPGYAADIIYKYVDDQGGTHYTDKPSLIPEKYCSRAQPFHSENAPVTIGSIPPVQPPGQAAAEPPPFYASWLEQISKLTMPPSFPYELAVGLVVVIVAMIIVLRLEMPPILKFLLTTALAALLVVGVYWMNSGGTNRGPTQLSGGCTAPGTPR